MQISFLLETPIILTTVLEQGDAGTQLYQPHDPVSMQDARAIVGEQPAEVAPEIGSEHTSASVTSLGAGMSRDEYVDWRYNRYGSPYTHASVTSLASHIPALFYSPYSGNNDGLIPAISTIRNDMLRRLNPDIPSLETIETVLNASVAITLVPSSSACPTAVDVYNDLQSRAGQCLPSGGYYEQSLGVLTPKGIVTHDHYGTHYGVPDGEGKSLAFLQNPASAQDPNSQWPSSGGWVGIEGSLGVAVVPFQSLTGTSEATKPTTIVLPDYVTPDMLGVPVSTGSISSSTSQYIAYVPGSNEIWVEQYGGYARHETIRIGQVTYWADNPYPAGEFLLEEDVTTTQSI